MAKNLFIFIILSLLVVVLSISTWIVLGAGNIGSVTHYFADTFSLQEIMPEPRDADVVFKEKDIHYKDVNKIARFSVVAGGEEATPGVQPTTNGEPVGENNKDKKPRTINCTSKDPSLAEGRVAVASYRDEEDVEISYDVGRAYFFTIYEDGNYVETIENPYADMDTSPGESVANMLAEKSVTAIVGGDMGPTITALFEERGIRPVRTCGEVKYFSELIS